MATSKTIAEPAEPSADPSGHSPAEAEPVVKRASKRPYLRRITRPEVGSLYDILRDNVGVSLYLPPVCWTDLHAQLLGVKFVSVGRIRKPVPLIDSSQFTEPSDLARHIGQELSTLLDPKAKRPYCKTRAIKNFMSIMFPEACSKPRSAVDLGLYFTHRFYDKAIRLPVVWRRADSLGASFDSAVTRPASFYGRVPSGNIWSSDGACNDRPNAPMLAYINRSQLATMRQSIFRVMPGPESENKLNSPVANLQKLRSKQLIPAELDHDAHFVAILLTMAQAHFHGSSSSTSSSQRSQPVSSQSRAKSIPEYRDVKVQLLTHDDEAEDFIVYTAVVSPTFLMRFREPARAPSLGECLSGGQDGAGMRIEYTRVAIWPILGLKERLGNALGPDFADFYYDDELYGPHGIEMWGCFQHTFPQQIPIAGFKRPRTERDALDEVLDKSFHYESDEEDLSPESKRRRCANSSHSLEVC